ncbi:unnamed protein product [Polarella glacialis]|uniref:Uncharacterized protein n=1 Tax=Polarella glacialis TaxID=89957 RepID=A0A813ESD7_POLGL|nr:unnamed protein product [Polarella glacialis]
MDIDKVLGDLPLVPMAACPRIRDFPVLIRWVNASHWNLLGFLSVHPCTNLNLVKGSFVSLMDRLYSNMRVSDVNCWVQVAEVNYTLEKGSRSLLIFRFPTEAIAQVLFECPLLASFWLTPFYGSQKDHGFETVNIGRPLPDAPRPSIFPAECQMTDATPFLPKGFHTATGLRLVAPALLREKTAAFASVRVSGIEVWALAIRMAKGPFRVDRAAIWTEEGWAPLILNDEMWKSLRTIDSQIGGLPYPHVGFPWTKYENKSFLIYPWDGLVTQDELATGASHAAGVISARWYTNEDYATGGFRDVLHWDNLISCPLVSLGKCNPSREVNALAWHLFPGRSFPKNYDDDDRKGFEWLDANKRMLYNLGHYALSDYMPKLDWFSAFKVAVNVECRKRRKLAGHGVLKVRLPVADTSDTNMPIDGNGAVPISVWIRNAGIGFSIISLSIAHRELQELFDVRAVIICEEDEWCRSLLQLVAPVAFPSAASILKRAGARAYTETGAILSSKTRFLVESCNMLGAQGYATFSDYASFHGRGLQDSEEMRACKGPFFQTCPSTQGGQRRPTNIFLYPGVHAGPIHPTEEFGAPKGWEWPTNEAKEHLSKNSVLSLEELTHGSIYPVALRPWIIEVGIPCYFGKTTNVGRNFNNFSHYEQWSVLSHLENKKEHTIAADLGYELALFGVPPAFRKIYLEYDPDGIGAGCLNTSLCGNGRPHCWKCVAKLVRVARSGDVLSHSRTMARHLRMWHGSVCYGQNTLIGHVLPIHICGQDCPYQQYVSCKFDTKYLKTNDARQPAPTSWADAEEEETEDESHLTPWRNVPARPSTASSARSPSSRCLVDSKVDQVAGSMQDSESEITSLVEQARREGSAASSAASLAELGAKRLEAQVRSLADAQARLLSVVEGISGDAERQYSHSGKAKADALTSVERVMSTVEELQRTVEQDGEGVSSRLREQGLAIDELRRSTAEDSSRHRATMAELQRLQSEAFARQRHCSDELSVACSSITATRQEVGELVQLVQRLERKLSGWREEVAAEDSNIVVLLGAMLQPTY